MTKRSKNASRREEMTPSEKRATVTISSSLKDIEQGREIFFLLKGKDLTIDTFSISDNSYRLHFVTGTTNKIPTPKGYCRLMINNIISDLKNGRIKSKTEYDFREFDERYLKDLKGLFSHKATTTSLQEEPTTGGVEHETHATGVTDSTTTELFQSERPTTEKVEYEAQEDSEYFAVEPAPLKQQKFDFASTNATGNTSDVIREMIESNTRNGITTENIMDVVFRSNNFTSRNVPAFSELSSTNATSPQLPNESGIAGTTVAGLSTLSAYIIAPVLLVAAVTVGGCWFLRKQKREDSYDVEKAGVENKVEAPFSEEQNSLLDEVNIEPGKYKSFQRNISDIL